jgi:hypothetical protein
VVLVLLHYRFIKPGQKEVPISTNTAKFLLMNNGEAATEMNQKQGIAQNILLNFSVHETFLFLTLWLLCNDCLA